MQAMRRNAEKCTAFRHQKTEMETIQLYMVYIDYKRRRLFLSENALKNKHIQA